VGVAVLGGLVGVAKSLLWARQKVFCISIEIYQTNKNVKRYKQFLCGMWALKLGVVNKLALRWAWQYGSQTCAASISLEAALGLESVCSRFYSS